MISYSKLVSTGLLQLQPAMYVLVLYMQGCNGCRTNSEQSTNLSNVIQPRALPNLGVTQGVTNQIAKRSSRVRLQTTSK